MLLLLDKRLKDVTVLHNSSMTTKNVLEFFMYKASLFQTFGTLLVDFCLNYRHIFTALRITRNII